MNLVGDVPLLLAIALAILLLGAGVQDAVSLKISNIFSITIALLAIIAMVVVGIELAVWENALVCFGLLVGGTLLFATGKFGGGDVKLFAATGLWFGLTGAVQLIATVFIAGGVLALTLLGSRMVMPKRSAERFRAMRKGAGIPYGVAIAIGGLIVIGMQRFN